MTKCHAEEAFITTKTTHMRYTEFKTRMRTRADVRAEDTLHLSRRGQEVFLQRFRKHPSLNNKPGHTSGETCRIGID